MFLSEGLVRRRILGKGCGGARRVQADVPTHQREGEGGRQREKEGQVERMTGQETVPVHATAGTQPRPFYRSSELLANQLAEVET